MTRKQQRKIFEAFMAGSSVEALAVFYNRPTLAIQDIIRKLMTPPLGGGGRKK